MLDRFFDFLIDSLIACFLPLVCLYHFLISDPFLNVAVESAPFLEKTANTLLIPLQYICDGKAAIQKEDGSWQFVQRFDYSHHFWIKTAGATLTLPISIILGGVVKAASFCSKTTRENYKALAAARNETQCSPNTAKYIEMGIRLDDSKPSEWLECQNFQRRAGDENHLAAMKRCLADLAVLFNEEKIPWWIDCGSCLGALRYGGVIPWDNDIDVSVMITDFENVRRVLNRLDRSKYLVQDWSGRDRPDCFFKIYMRESCELLDVFFYDVDPASKTMSCIFALDANIFFPEWWKDRERSFTVSTSFDSVFPLKKALFDGIEVYVPNDTVKFLTRYYGENLQPARIFDETTGRYEKDLSHPYWKMSFGH